MVEERGVSMRQYPHLLSLPGQLPLRFTTTVIYRSQRGFINRILILYNSRNLIAIIICIMSLNSNVPPLEFYWVKTCHFIGSGIKNPEVRKGERVGVISPSWAPGLNQCAYRVPYFPSPRFFSKKTRLPLDQL